MTVHTYYFTDALIECKIKKKFTIFFLYFSFFLTKTMPRGEIVQSKYDNVSIYYFIIYNFIGVIRTNDTA